MAHDGPINAEQQIHARDKERDHEPAWTGQGITLDTNGKKGLTVEQALPASGLDWTVEKVPLMAYLPENITKDPTPPNKDGVLSPHGMTTVPKRFGVQRSDTGEILGTVGATWQPVRNLEGFAILDDVISQASALDIGYNLWIESAGTIDSGRKVWVLAHIDQDMQIAGESYVSHLLFMNGHDGRTSVTAAAMFERFYCSNQLTYNSGNRIVRIRHTTKASQRVKEAHVILGMRNQRAEELAKQGEWLVNQKFNEKKFQDFLAELMPIAEPDTPAATMVADRRAAVTRLYQETPNLADIRDTRWGALQAIVEYSQHYRPFRDAETKLKATWGLTPAPLPDKALALLTA